MFDMSRGSLGYLIYLLLLLTLVSGSVDAGPVEDALEAHWRGAFVVLKVESRSGCGDAYTNNPVFGARLGGQGEHRLGPGELAQVRKVDVKRNRVDLLLDIVEPLRISYQDGPFQLFRQAECRIELKFEISRSALKKGGVAEADSHFLKILERHETLSSVEASALYNARRVEPFPPGYDDVLAEYEAWKEEQVSLAVHDRLAEALDAANRISNQVRTSQSYSEGFTAGLRYVNSSYLIGGDCYALLDKVFYPADSNPPIAVGYDASEWQAGHRDGQALVFHLELARGLARCIR